MPIYSTIFYRGVINHPFDTARCLPYETSSCPRTQTTSPNLLAYYLSFSLSLSLSHTHTHTHIHTHTLSLCLSHTHKHTHTNTHTPSLSLSLTPGSVGDRKGVPPVVEGLVVVVVPHLFSRVEFRVSSFGLRVSGLVFRVSCFGSQVWGVVFGVEG